MLSQQNAWNQLKDEDKPGQHELTSAASDSLKHKSRVGDDAAFVFREAARGLRYSLLDCCLSPKQAALADLDAGRAEDDGEQHRQEEQDHRHGELGRQGGGLLLGLVHAHVAAFAGEHAQAPGPTGVP